MALTVETKKDQIWGLCDQIDSKFNALDPLVYPRVIEVTPLVGSMKAGAGTVTTATRAMLSSDFGDLTSAASNYGLPCGLSNFLDKDEIMAWFKDKWDIFGDSEDGGFFDDVITELQRLYAMAESQLNEMLDALTSAKDFVVATVAPYIASVQAAADDFIAFAKESLGGFGVLGEMFGCAKEMFDSVKPFVDSPFLKEINPAYGTAAKALSDAQALYTKPSDIMAYSQNQLKTQMGYDVNLTSKAGAMSTIKTNFPANYPPH